MTEYSRMAKGNFTAAGTTGVVYLPFIPDYVELWNYTNIKTAGTHSATRAWWDVNLVDSANNPTMIELYAGSSSSVVFDTIQTNGISTFQAALGQQFGPAQQVVSATAANPTVFTVTGHGYNVGDTVVFNGLYQTSTTGMAQMATIPFTISAVTTNSFTVKWNGLGSNYTALSGSPAGATVRKVLYPFLYLPEDNVVSAITTGSSKTVIQTTMYHNFVVGQEVAFRIPTAWGTTQLNSLPNNVIPGQPIYGIVTDVTGTVNSVTLDNWTFAVAINSSSFTAFNPNQTIASVPGLSYPQVVGVGNFNYGAGGTITATNLYPSPTYPTSSGGVAIQNGPTIKGSFVTNTNQGFLIGAGAAAVDTSTTSFMTTNNVVYWHAYAHDLGQP